MSVRFDDAKAAVDERDEFEALYGPLDDGLDLERETVVDYDDRDLAAAPPAGATYVLPRVPLTDRAFFRETERDIARRVTAREALELRRNVKLKLVSRPGESPEAFAQRCDEAAQTRRRRGDGQAARSPRSAAGPPRGRARPGAGARRGAHARRAHPPGGRARRRRRRRARRALRRPSPHALDRRLTRSHRRGLASAAAPPRPRPPRCATTCSRSSRRSPTQCTEIDAKWRVVADQIDTVAIRPEAADVHVERLAVVWVPR